MAKGLRMKSLSLVLVVAVAAMIGSAGPPDMTAVALISKVVSDVMRKSEGKEWSKAVRGETLISGDKIRTGGNSLAIIKFKDNSMVRVRELSELTITGDMVGKAFSKSVRLEQGVLGFNVRKQQPQEQFRFSSPTSVASIRGTRGQFVSQGLSDTLVVVEGMVVFQNVKSSQSVEVPAGSTGISRPDGSIRTRPATPEELKAAEDVARVLDQDNQFELELRDSQGNRKKLKIDFQD